MVEVKKQEQIENIVEVTPKRKETIIIGPRSQKQIDDKEIRLAIRNKTKDITFKLTLEDKPPTKEEVESGV